MRLVSDLGSIRGAEEPAPPYRDRSRVPAVLILDEDPELAETLPVSDQGVARRLLWAPLITAEKGPWRPPPEPQGPSLGLLVLDGALTRTITVDSGSACELLGPGDLIRPWDEDEPTDMGPVPMIEWKVLEPVRIARLDARLTALLVRWPALMVALSRRSLRRSGTLSYLLAVSHGVRVEEKLLVALWHIADTWGRVTPRGVLLRLPLTHEMLGQIIGAKRPSVWAALKVLHERGLVRRVKEGYLLLGDPDARASDSLEHGHAASAEDVGEAGVDPERALFAS